MIEHTCKYCNTKFTGHKRKYCSPKCRQRSAKNVIILNKGYCKVCCKDISDKNSIAKYCSYQCQMVGNRLKNPTYTCSYCEKKYKPLYKKRERDKTEFTFCSKNCRSNFIMNGNMNKRDWELIKLRKEIIKKAKATVYEFTIKIQKRLRQERILDAKKRKCKVCGDVFISTWPGYYSVCSKECSDKHLRITAYNSKHKRLRRKNKNGGYETIDPDYVLERDKHRCQICGTYTPKKLRGSYKDNSPEIDHIIPISKGGKHLYSNVQTLCRKCNRDKSNRLSYYDEEKNIKVVMGRAQTKV